MSIYDTDLVQVNSATEDEITGENIPDSNTNIKCRLEESNGVMYGPRGERLVTTGIIFIDKKNLVAPSYNDEILIIEKNGAPYFDAARKFKILKIMQQGIGGMQFWEITY